MKRIRQLVYLSFGLLCFSSFESKAQVAMEQSKVVAPDRATWERFGENGAVSIDGNFAVVGSHYHSELAANGGSVYLYEYIGTTCEWEFRDEIFPQLLDGTLDPGADDFFGTSVSLFGTTLAVGSPGHNNNGADGIGSVVDGGKVYIYDISSGTGVIEQHIYPFNNSGAEDQLSGDSFGRSVHLSATHLIVGDDTDNTNAFGVPTGLTAPGAAFIYELSGTFSYTFQDKIVSNSPLTNDRFGCSVSISTDYASVGAWQGGPGSAPGFMGIGEVEVFEWMTGPSEWQWDVTFAGDIDPFASEPIDDWDWFGIEIEMNQTHLVVGSPFDEHDASGASPLNWAGSVYIYELSGGVWAFQQKIDASDRSAGRRFGVDVSISPNGQILVGSPNVGNGRAYLFEESGGIWSETEIITAELGTGGDLFGSSVDMVGNNIIVAASYDDTNEDELVPITQAGSAYLFEINEPADMPVIEVMGALCIDGGLITLSIVDGDLNDADEWEWYEDGCDGVPIGTGESIEVLFEEGAVYCARGVGNCDWFDDGECGCITLEGTDGFWHKQTNDGVYDNGTDVVTDSEGNVYMAGHYYTKTTFEGGSVPDLAIASGDADGKSYVVKYDNCGNLVWVAYSIDTDPSDDDFAVSITLNELTQQVYVLGNYGTSMLFQSAVGDGDVDPTPMLGLPGSLNYRAYVAGFDMDDGDLNLLEPITFGTITQASDITINEATGDIYVGGNYSGPGGYKLFVQRYLPTLSAIGAPIWTINGYNFKRENVRGLDYDETSNSLWMLGDYRGSFQLLTSPVVTAVNTDAFVAKINDAVIPSLGGFGNGNISNNMYGGGIAVEEATGNAFVTGYYEGFSSNVFGLGQPLSFIYSTGEHAYFIGIDAGMNPVWSATKAGAAFTGQVRGVDVTCMDGQACFVGTFNHASADLTGGSGIPYTVSGATLNADHLFSVSYDAAVGPGPMNWENATADFTNNNGVHTPTGIDAGPFGNAFISGGFQARMDYLSGAPASLDLFTPTQLASFTMRVEADVAGAFQLPTTVEDDESIESETLQNGDLAFFMNVYPNPISNDVTIEVGNFDSDQIGTITVLNLDGKVVLNQELQSNQMRIDFSELDAGVYFIQVTNGDQTAVKRVVKP